MALESLKECSFSSVNNIWWLKGKSSMAYCTSAMPEFYIQDTLLMVTAKDITLAEGSVTSSKDCKDVLAMKQPLLTNAQSFFLEVSGSWSGNLDMIVQFTKSYLDDICWFCNPHL